MKDEILTIGELAAYRLVSEKKIPGFKIGGSWRFRRNEINAWIKAQELKAKGEK